jgi:nicotinamide-nucleotide amidase
MKIEILCTGDEILSGKTTNTNYSFMARRLTENGFVVYWGTVVGDDRESLVTAFKLASTRADIVIVNGGLGPTIDDLSQEVAAQAAGVELELHQPWKENISEWYSARGRVMPENNVKQAMLPVGAEFIDNPIGTACGFAIDINGSRFYFTPGVPRELRRMLNEQIIPRLQTIRGGEVITRVKRFHTFGIGESRADIMLEGIELMAGDGSVKLGFQSHYPQLEMKLTVQGQSESELDAKLEPIELEMRRILGNFIVAEDDEALEGLVLKALKECDGTLSVIEMDTAGTIATRLLAKPENAEQFNQSRVSKDFRLFSDLASMESGVDKISEELGRKLAASLIENENISHGLVVLTEPKVEEGDASTSANIIIVITDGKRVKVRAAQLWGNRDWMRVGASEMALDCLRRYLLGLPVYERIDFEQH